MPAYPGTPRCLKAPPRADYLRIHTLRSQSDILRAEEDSNWHLPSEVSGSAPLKHSQTGPAESLPALFPSMNPGNKIPVRRTRIPHGSCSGGY